MSKGALFYILHKVSQAGVWPIVLIFAATSLNKQEQGLFFAMLSFGAFQALAEFGVNAGLIHFLSHEAASRSDRSIFHEVDISRFGRVREIILKSLRWTFFFGGAIACGMVFLGAWFFQAKDYGVSRQDWLAPWIFYCLSIFINLIYLNLKSVAEGVGNLFGSQLSAVVGVLCGGGAMIHSLWVGLGLYALPIGLMVNSVVGLLVVSISVRKWLCAALKSDPGETESGFDWWAEFWPHQWRLAFSWFCGILMFQTFVPSVYYFQGPVAAGQVGVALAIFNLLNSVSMVWIAKEQVTIGMAWSRRDVSQLLALRSNLVKFSVGSAAVGAVLVVLLLLLVERYFINYSDRVVGVMIILPLMLAAVFLQVSNVDTTIVRFGRVEIFNGISLFGAIVVSLLNWGLARRGVGYVFLSYAVFIAVVFVPWVRWRARERLDAINGKVLF